MKMFYRKRSVVKQIYFLTVILVCFFVPAGSAELVILKNGSAVEGKITERVGKKIIMDIKGVAMTYYLDEIEVIDGVVPSAPAPAPVPVTKPAIAPAAHPIPPGTSKKDLILEFIDVFGTRTSLTQNFEDVIKSAPSKQAKEFQKSVKVDEIIEALVPIYDKYFTPEELQAYIDFYSSPAGKKLVETIPHVMTDSVGVSLKYFQTKLPGIPAQEMK